MTELTEMMEMMKAMKDEMQSGFSKMQEEMDQSRTNLENRLQHLETADTPQGDKGEKDTENGNGALQQELVMPAREKQLTKQFGMDTSANALLEFLDHYLLCRDMNQQRKVPGWDDAKYRAKELRYQLQGEAAVFVRQEEAMHQNWVLDDDAIIGKLKERWFNRDCIEMDILEFEEARQGDYETLAQFMQRVKGLGQRAFSEFDANGMHQRIVWRFLDGVKDKEIRGAIIRERWMKDRTTPKPYDEVLKIATNAHMTKVAAQATGGGNGSQLAKGKLAAMNKVTPTPSGNKGKVKKPAGSMGTSEMPRVFDCFYCHKRHAGGYRECSKRLKENPNWTPRSDRDYMESQGGHNTNRNRPSPLSPSGSDASQRSSGSSQSFRMSPSP